MLRATLASIVLLVAAQLSLGDDSDAPEQEVLTIPDAGRRFELGELYDARTDQFVSGRLWSAQSIFEHSYQTNASSTSLDAVQDDSIRSKVRLMDISAEFALKVNLNPGQLNLQTSFRYLSEKRRTSYTVRMATGFKTRTIRQKLDIFNDAMLGSINGYVVGDSPRCSENKKQCRKATHVVTSVVWGADVYTLFETSFRSSYERDLLYNYLRFKLKLPMTMSLDLETEFLRDRVDVSRVNQTRVTVFGDLNLKRELPTTLDDAIAFMRALPAETNTLVGVGVPMEITLTPIAWLWHDAARLMQRINADTLERLTDIYEAFDNSEALILDMLATKYLGFKAWKSSAEAFYGDFRAFRSSFSAQLFKTMQSFANGFLNQTALEEAEQRYLASPFNEAAVEAAVEERLDQIANLVALVSRFEEADVTFADSVSSFFAPTFDSRFDRVYGLVLVGFNPSNDREGIGRVRDFVNLAKARQVKEATPEHLDVVKHCVERKDSASNESVICVERQAFVAVHLESRCLSFCRPEFCQTDPAGKHQCPTSASSKPPCEISAAAAENLRCSLNNFTGQCGFDPEHDADNYELAPISDCWCACPRTQVLEYFKSQPARGLREKMPRAPQPPQVQGVSGHDDPEPLPEQQVLFVRLNTSAPDGARNYRAVVLWNEVHTSGSLTTFVEKQLSVDTPGRRDIIAVRNLIAGREYRIEVQGVSSEGVSLPTQVPGSFVAAHRMATVRFPTKGDYQHDHNSGPGWLSLHSSIELSTPAFEELGKVSLHMGAELPESVDRKTFGEAAATRLALAEGCSAASRQSISCALPLGTAAAAAASSRSGEVTLQLLVWDVSDILAGFANITLLPPSATWCPRFGAAEHFCPLADGSCTASCFACSPERISVGNTCIGAMCAAENLWCPSQDECINKTANPSAACDSWCKDTDEPDSKGAIFFQIDATNGSHPVDTCLSSCKLDLPPAYTTGLVQRGKSVLIDCDSKHHRLRGTAAEFTCPLQGATRRDMTFKYDEGAVLRNSNQSALPVCGSCPSDMTWDAGLGKCRYFRSPGAGWNYIDNGDFEFSDSTTPLFYDFVGTTVVMVSGGAHGVGNAVTLLASDGELALSQKVKLHHLQQATGKAPPVGSVWQASLVYQLQKDRGVYGSPQLCLRDRDPPETTSLRCAALLTPSANSSAAAWHRVEVQFTALPGASLLAVDVWGGRLELKLDRLEVAPVTGYEEPILSSGDIAETVLKPLREELGHKADKAAIDSSIQALLADLSHKADTSVTNALEGTLRTVQDDLSTRPHKMRCRVCYGCPAYAGCDCGFHCSDYVQIGEVGPQGGWSNYATFNNRRRRDGCPPKFLFQCD